jgi:hypothetical protein
MADSYVELRDLPVLRVRADMKGRGPAEAFARLEAKLPTLKGRRFYGVIYLDAHDELQTYFACVDRQPTDDPSALEVEDGIIPGGLYARCKFPEWQKNLGQLKGAFDELARRHQLDGARPSLEFYRSQQELWLMVPVRSRGEPTTPR